MSVPGQALLLRVFAGEGSRGGNPAPIVLDASPMSDEQMRQVALHAGHESGFVLPPNAGSGADLRMRFFVPLHEMEMCGHATVGGLWALRQAGLWRSDHITVETRSGLVEGLVRNVGTGDEMIEITQPMGRLATLEGEAVFGSICQALNIAQHDLLPVPLLNASTSRVKTLVGVKSVEVLDTMTPDFSRVKAVCEQIESTGLYPFAVGSSADRVFHARQFPKASGYPEDAATGIAAAALLFGLHRCNLVALDDRPVIVIQGRAMGCPSEIRVRFRFNGQGTVIGCYVGGNVVQENPSS
jgi:PhzF family phenazine biosynthesis protein